MACSSSTARAFGPDFTLALSLLLLGACSSGDANDAGTSYYGTFGMETDTVGTGVDDVETVDTSSDDSSDPCANVEPCVDATADIPISGGVGSASFPSLDIDTSPWAMSGGTTMNGTAA
ncbi:MAG: hypothetical protein KC457_15180, partial [Myxococcales bacterium]|nr:hypothetical protein [Myxococcales bacterium]